MCLLSADHYPGGDDEAVPATALEVAALRSPAGPMTGPSSAGAGFDLSPGALPSIGGLSGCAPGLLSSVN